MFELYKLWKLHQQLGIDNGGLLRKHIKPTLRDFKASTVRIIQKPSLLQIGPCPFDTMSKSVTTVRQRLLTRRFREFEVVCNGNLSFANFVFFSILRKF